MVTGGAYVTIITGGVVEKVHTTVSRVTRVRCTDIFIIAVQESPVGADTLGTMVPHSALIAIAALRLVGQMLTKALLVAGIVRAGISIVTIYLGTRATGSIRALIVDSTGITIITRCGDGCVHAAAVGVTAVLGAHITVITIWGSRKEAFAAGTVIASGARVAVVAVSRIGLEHASLFGVATIIRAYVIIAAD